MSNVVDIPIIARGRIIMPGEDAVELKGRGGAAFRQADPAFAWRQPPYEYEHTKLPVDILSGSSTLRDQIESGMAATAIAATWRPHIPAALMTNSARTRPRSVTTPAMAPSGDRSMPVTRTPVSTATPSARGKPAPRPSSASVHRREASKRCPRCSS